MDCHSIKWHDLKCLACGLTEEAHTNLVTLSFPFLSADTPSSWGHHPHAFHIQLSKTNNGHALLLWTAKWSTSVTWTTAAFDLHYHVCDHQQLFGFCSTYGHIYDDTFNSGLKGNTPFPLNTSVKKDMKNISVRVTTKE